VARELAIVTSYFLEEALGISTPHEGLDGIAERMVRTCPLVEDDEDARMSKRGQACSDASREGRPFSETFSCTHTRETFRKSMVFP
jgi:hypothetical protein